MTENEREAGRWQGEVSARMTDIDRRVASMEGKLDDRANIVHQHASRIASLETRQSIMWSALAAAAMTIATMAFKIYVGG